MEWRAEPIPDVLKRFALLHYCRCRRAHRLSNYILNSVRPILHPAEASSKSTT